MAVSTRFKPAFLAVKLKHLPEWTEQRRAAAQYRDLFAGEEVLSATLRAGVEQSRLSSFRRSGREP